MNWFKGDNNWFNVESDDKHLETVGKALVGIGKFGKKSFDMILRANELTARGIMSTLNGVEWIAGKMGKEYTTPRYAYPFVHLLGLSTVQAVGFQLLYEYTGWHPFMLGEQIVPGVLTISDILLAVHAWKNVYSREEDKPFGNARFAELRELKKTGLIGEYGIVLGKLKKKLVTKNKDKEGHTLIMGPPGTGKTSGVVIPSLLLWRGSALVLDIKDSELYRKTGSIRSRLQKTFVFDPTRPGGNQYNPVDFCETPDKANAVSQVLIEDAGEENSFFVNGARGVLSACLLEGYHTGQSLVDVLRRICDTPGIQLADELETSTIPHVRTLASTLINVKSDAKTLGLIMAELTTSLSPLATDDNIARATEKTEWSPKEFEKGMTVYLSIPESKIKLSQYKKLLQVIISQTMDYLTERPEGKEPPILIMIDELYALGKLPQLSEMLSTLRSRNVHIVLSFQALSQLDERYGRSGRNTIVGNCAYKVILGIDDPDTQQFFTRLSGQRTIETTSTSQREKDDHTTKTTSQTGVPLIRPEEWSRLKESNELVLFSPDNYPVKLQKIKYWDDKLLNSILDRELKQLEEKRVPSTEVLPPNVVPFGTKKEKPKKPSTTSKTKLEDLIDVEEK